MFSVRNHVKLMHVINSDLLGIADLHWAKGQKYQMVKTQTESHVRRPVV